MSNHPLNPDGIHPHYTDDLPTADELRSKAQQALRNPPTVSDKHKALIICTVATVVLFKIEKRMVKKVVKKAFESYPVRIDLASYMADLDVYDKAQWAVSEAARSGRR